MRKETDSSTVILLPNHMTAAVNLIAVRAKLDRVSSDDVHVGVLEVGAMPTQVDTAR